METTTTNTEPWEKQMEALYHEMEALRKKAIELKKKRGSGAVKDYEFKNHNGGVTKLSELFGDKQDLIVVHNMGKSCPYCTLWADGFIGLMDHLSSRAAFVVVSPNGPEIQKEFAESRGWKFPMYSAVESDFTADMGYSSVHEGKTYYMPGMSTFRKDEDGTIRHIASDMFGPGDSYNSAWHFFDLLEDGANNWQPQYSYQ